ncbi:NlpC/P60 family protein [Desulfosporosinus nitroreducens]|uniref:NlpC/P60 family protein n=1 Tax=Desulfosporosinus nitroreducens TaxID=2018668 RepID=A0ABT8QL09_9FIRM|nr:NlpC/P60 family protein [Desulfosporosinus nitroreducens]MCO1601485.1 NlpC/P60 family protein [Desulfosporosinus nitroreducens]MDO0821981.1 NlpC/P60 family protein [Desulfosporosinus nitroreducens]
MKKKIVLVFFLICLMLSLPGTAKASLGDVLLQVGSRGPDVVELQTKLNYVGFNVGKADGIFGNMTKEGVMDFQRANSLVVDGKVGPMTVQSLYKVYLQKQTQTQLQTQTQNKVNSILSTAKQYIGVWYQWGGTSPSTGFDCSGFVYYVFKQNGITLPRVSRDQYTVGTKVSFENLQPGDLVFFSFSGNGVVDHDGIYLGGGQFINSSSSKGVTIYTIGPYWKSVYVGARRVI